MNVLIIGKDPTLFESGKETFGDTRKRHIAYARALQRRWPGSSIRIITYTPSAARYKVEQVEEGLTLYPTCSFHRATFICDVVRFFPRVLRGWKPDLITVQTPYEEGLLGFFLSRFVEAKFFPQLHFDLFSEDWRQEHWLNGWRRRVSSWVIKRADGVRVVSEALKSKLVERLDVPEDRVSVLPVAVNFTPVDRAEKGNACKAVINPKLAGRPVVLFVGRFYAPKNLPLWVEVAERVSREVPDAYFVMAGDGPLLAEIRALVETKKLAERFCFLGKVGHERLPEVYAAADLFLLTSNYEGYGRVVVEAHFAGLPVVSTKSTGPESLIVDGETGYLHPLKDVEGLSQSVVHLLSDPGLREAMGQAGKKRVEQQFSLDTLVEQLIAAWGELCSKPPNLSNMGPAKSGRK